MVRVEKIEYSENRRRADKAASYNVKYERQLHKRLSDWREKRLLARLLAPTAQNDLVLDVPCGAGRLSGVIAGHARQLVEVDYSREMVKLCRANAAGHTPWVTAASAFQLPFGDATFDLVVSIRLSHHIPEREARKDHIRELLRVSRRWVLVTFFGEETLKNRLRNVYRSLGGRKRAKLTLRGSEVAEVARQAGFRVVRSRGISPLLSGHRFTLLERSR